jgi:hypothetical protein
MFLAPARSKAWATRQIIRTFGGSIGRAKKKSAALQPPSVNRPPSVSIFQNSSTTVLGDFVGRLEGWALQNAAATKTSIPLSQINRICPILDYGVSGGLAHPLAERSSI